MDNGFQPILEARLRALHDFHFPGKDPYYTLTLSSSMSDLAFAVVETRDERVSQFIESLRAAGIKLNADEGRITAILQPNPGTILKLDEALAYAQGKKAEHFFIDALRGAEEVFGNAGKAPIEAKRLALTAASRVLSLRPGSSA